MFPIRPFTSSVVSSTIFEKPSNLLCICQNTAGVAVSEWLPLISPVVVRRWRHPAVCDCTSTTDAQINPAVSLTAELGGLCLSDHDLPDAHIDLT